MAIPSWRAFGAPALLLLICSLVLVSCAQPGTAPPAGNALACVSDFDSSTDYFPDKVTFAHATGVRVTYTNHTKILEIDRPWHGADEPVRVLLVQCGTPRPEVSDADVVIDVPVERAATFSTTQLPSFALLERADVVVAHAGLDYVSTAEIRAAAQAGRIREVGDQTDPDVEQLVAASPDVALLSAGVDGDEHRRAVARTGIPAVPYADWLEETPLGRAEWLKVVALLLNAEAGATETFDDIEAATNAVLARAEAVDSRPKVVAGASYEGTWYMPAGGSYVGAALTALGADYPWAETEGTGALSLDLEAVIAEAMDAQVWIGAGSVRGSLDELGAIDDRFTSFAAFRTGQVYADDRRMGPGGGNDFYELGAVRPDLVLADLYKILHPDAARDIEFTFYGRVGELAEAQP